MDQHAASTNPGEQNFFKPDEVPVSSPSVSTPVNSSQPLAQSDPITNIPSQVSSPRSFAWTASEFVGHQKTRSWYIGLGIVMILVALLIWFIAKDVFLVVAIMIGVIVFGVYAGRSPRQQKYVVDEAGVSVGEHQYPFKEFSSFSVTSEGSLLSIELSPLKRFAFYTTIYIQPADEEKIISILSTHLPLTPPRNDFTDQLMRRIKF